MPYRHVDSESRDVAFVRKFLPAYHAAVFTIEDFIPADLPVQRAAVIPVAIGPLSPKNVDVGDALARSVIEWLGISSKYPWSPRWRASIHGRIRSAGSLGIGREPGSRAALVSPKCPTRSAVTDPRRGPR
jgi:hypothetical protein